MKKFRYVFSILPALALAFVAGGCILDAFDEITQNLSIERSFTVSGNTSALVTQSGTFRLADSKVYTDNRDKIKKMQFKAAAFWVTQNTVPSLQGDIILTLRNTTTGTVLFTKTLSAFRPSDYLGVSAKNLDLTQTEIDAINAAVSNVDQLETLTFTATMAFQNVTPANTQATMQASISLVFAMTFNP
ncbi:MAG: hypothetical protein ACM3Q4_10225 [Acidobacteriota bacterium]